MERRLLFAILTGPVFVAGLVLLNSSWTFQLRELSWRLLLVSVLVYPVCEEIIFRGFLQNELAKRRFLTRNFAGISLANGLASAVFALVHVLVFQNAYALLVFFPGLIFGYFFERHNSLFLPIMLHCLYNLTGLFGPSVW